jgi:hypothetical protein
MLHKVHTWCNGRHPKSQCTAIFLKQALRDGKSNCIAAWKMSTLLKTYKAHVEFRGTNFRYTIAVILLIAWHRFHFDIGPVRFYQHSYVDVISYYSYPYPLRKDVCGDMWTAMCFDSQSWCHSVPFSCCVWLFNQLPADAWAWAEWGCGNSKGYCPLALKWPVKAPWERVMLMKKGTACSNGGCCEATFCTSHARANQRWCFSKKDRFAEWTCVKGCDAWRIHHTSR